MKIVRAATLGYCMGVRRAVDAVLAEIDSVQKGERCGPVLTLGPLIHNPAALAYLSSLGVRIIESPEEASSYPGASVVIRAHGVPPSVYETLSRLGLRVIDATCPRVATSQRKAAALASRGLTLFLAGEAKHAEVVGIASRAPGCVVVANPEEARAAARDLSAKDAHARTAVLAQTTIKRSEFLAIAGEVVSLFPDAEIQDSICPATDKRQEATRRLVSQVDAIIVIGGKSSANTRRLFLTAQEAGAPAWMVEGPSEIPEEIYSFSTVGLAAGASTPDEIIDEVEAVLVSGGRKT